LSDLDGQPIRRTETELLAEVAVERHLGDRVAGPMQPLFQLVERHGGAEMQLDAGLLGGDQDNLDDAQLEKDPAGVVAPVDHLGAELLVERDRRGEVADADERP